MVTLNSADNALKTFYLEALTDTLDNKTNPFLAKIEKTSKNVSGKDIKMAVKVRNFISSLLKWLQIAAFCPARLRF